MSFSRDVVLAVMSPFTCDVAFLEGRPLDTDARRSVGAFAGVTFIMVLGNTMLFPVFPEMREALGLTSRQLAWLVLSISVPSALFAPIGGMLADRVGRRRIILPSLWAYGLGGLGAGSAALWLSDPFPWMLAGRVLQGLGSGAPMHLTMAMVGDIFQSRERTKALGIVESANSFGKVASPLIGAGVGLLGWFAPFFVYPAAALLASLAIWFWTREPARSPGARESWGGYKQAVLHALERRHVLIAFFSALVVMLLLMGVLFWVADVLPSRERMSPLVRGVTLALPMLTSAAAALLAQRVGERLGIVRSVLWGLLLMGTAGIALPWLGSSALVYLLLAVFGFGTGTALTGLNTLAISSAPGEYRGAVTAVYGALRSLGAAVAPAVFVGLRDGWGPLPFVLFGGAVLLAGGATLFIKESEALPARLRTR